MKKMASGMYHIRGEGAFEYLAKAQALEREGKTILHFEIGQPDFPTPEHIKETAYDSIKTDFTGYVAATGIIELKQAIQDEVEKSRGFRPDIDQILILPGAKPGIFFTMFLNFCSCSLLQNLSNRMANSALRWSAIWQIRCRCCFSECCLYQSERTVTRV